MKEIWKAIDGYEGYYEVSNFGRVKSLARNVISRGRTYSKKERIMNPAIDTPGYPFVELYINGYGSQRRVHRLVAETFIPNPKSLPEVNHLDGNKENNKASNLEWSTGSQNTRHAVRHGLIDMDKALNARRKPIICTTTGDIYASATEAAKMMGINRQSISRVAAGSRKSIHGYHFQFAEQEQL